MDETLSRLADSADKVSKKFYGVTVGRVINPLDPMALGRVQVQLPMIDSLDLSPWARVAVPMAGIAHGTYFIPNPGDEVLVAFEQGDLNAPYVIGSLWNATAPPPLPSPIPQIRMIRTPIGNQIMFTEAPPSVTILTPSGQTIVLSPAGIQIQSAANVISMTPDGITVTGNPKLTLVSGGSIDLTAPKVSINGAAAAEVKSAGVCNVTAPLVKIN
ncbi:MAG TPA: phage baseplate assembly protein V [Thermoanaerobaculia bacterium]|jgi:phage baseplate assembly protein gpV